MTDRLRFRTIARLALSWGLLAALCLACTVEEGERATSGACPEGETCSDTTPTGLTFYGPPPSDGEQEFLPHLAVRGSFNLGYQRNDEGGRIDAVAESSADWFMQVEPADADRDAYALWHGEDDVRVSANGPGEAYLRIVDANTGELYDRVQITVERIDTVGAVDGLGEPIEALAPGQAATIVFTLTSDSQKRLVDESMAIESELEFERASWDCIDFVVPDDADEVSFVIDAGHRRWEVAIPVSN